VTAGGPARPALFSARVDPIRLLHGFYVNAGIKPKAARYGGWETEGIEGHSLGHYLSACALMFAATGDEQLKKNANLIVDELAECQAKHGDGFFGGMPQADRIFSEIKKRDIRSQGFDLNGNWVPWYNIHKTQAGLLDTYQYLGKRTGKGYAEWEARQKGLLPPEEPKKGKKGKKTDE
jgi:DUF1680 family protein